MLVEVDTLGTMLMRIKFYNFKFILNISLIKKKQKQFFLGDSKQP